MDYQTIKNWFAEKENKRKCVYGVCFALVFLIGFGAGSFDKELQKAKVKLKSPVNYTTKPSQNQATVVTPVGAPGEGNVAAAAPEVKGDITDANCPIKGNINTKGNKIYHIQGGAFYKITKPEQCFQIEAAASAAGFVKSSR